MADVLAHEMGENRADALFQAQGTTESYEGNHDTVVDGMYGGMMDAFKGVEEDITRDQFDAEHPIESAYHDGLNDAVAEDRAEAFASGGKDGLERYQASATAKRWAETSQERAGAQKASMRRQVSGRSEWKHGGTDLARNPNGRQLPDTSGVTKAGPDDGLGIV